MSVCGVFCCCCFFCFLSLHNHLNKFPTRNVDSHLIQRLEPGGSLMLGPPCLCTVGPVINFWSQCIYSVLVIKLHICPANYNTAKILSNITFLCPSVCLTAMSLITPSSRPSILPCFTLLCALSLLSLCAGPLASLRSLSPSGLPPEVLDLDLASFIFSSSALWMVWALTLVCLCSLSSVLVLVWLCCQFQILHCNFSIINLVYSLHVIYCMSVHPGRSFLCLCLFLRFLPASVNLSIRTQNNLLIVLFLSVSVDI